MRIIAYLTLAFLLAGAPAWGQPTVASLRSTVEADIPDNVTEEVSPRDVRVNFLTVADLLAERPTTSAATTLIAPFARQTPVGTIPDAALPNHLRQANLAIPATWARSIPAPTGRAPLSVLPEQLSYIPDTDCASGEVWQRGASTWGCAVVSGGGGGGLSTAQVDLRIATWARANAPTGTAPAVRLAASPGANEFLRAASGGGTDWRGIVDADLPASIARDTELPTIRSDGEIDSRVAPWARATPVGMVPLASIPNLPAARVTTGTFLTSQIPAVIARDAEIESWAIIASTGAAAIIPANVIDAALTRNANLPSALLGTSLVGVNVGDCFRRAAGSDGGALTTARLLFTFEPCPTGGGGDDLTVRTVRPPANVAVDSPAQAGGSSPWTDLVSITIAASEAGAVEFNFHGLATLTASPAIGAQLAGTALAGGGDRVHTDFRVRLTRGAATTTEYEAEAYGPRNLPAQANTNAAYAAATHRVSFSASWAITVQTGDIVTLQVQHASQRTTPVGETARRLTWSATASGMQIVH